MGLLDTLSGPADVRRMARQDLRFDAPHRADEDWVMAERRHFARETEGGDQVPSGASACDENLHNCTCGVRRAALQ